MKTINQFRASFTRLSALTAVAAFTLTTGTAGTYLPPPANTVSTIPSNGDVNPYGVAFVPLNVTTGGALHPGDVLVSNFNNKLNLQGTGTTIIRIDNSHKVSTFYQASKGHGLTAALGVTQEGFVFVGSLPTTDGTMNTVKPGSILILNNKGQLVQELASNPVLIDGPWGMAINDQGATAQVFYSNVMSGTVVRLDVEFNQNGMPVTVLDTVEIASGYPHRLDPAAVVLGPSGLLFNPANKTLYVADSEDDTIYAIADASRIKTAGGVGTAIYTDAVHLHGPLDLAMVPNGDLIVANSDGTNVDPNQPSELVEFTTQGVFKSQFSVDPNNGGAFGLGSQWVGTNQAFRCAAVDDNANSLTIWTKVF